MNSLGARSEQVLTWRVERKIDVALLQQTKCTDGDFPFDEFAEIGYQKTWLMASSPQPGSPSRD